jgi:hypothetical protein
MIRESSQSSRSIKLWLAHFLGKLEAGLVT